MLSKILKCMLLLCLLCPQAFAEEKKSYVIGLTPHGVRVASVEDIELGFNYELNKLTKDKNFDFKIKVYPNIDHLNQLVLQKDILGYFGSPILLVQHPELFIQQSVFSPVLSEHVLQRYLLLVRKDSGITSLEQLKNTVFGYCAVDEVGLLHLTKILKDKKLGTFEDFFAKTSIKKNPNLAISALFFKELKATMVLETDFKIAAELNPQLKSQLVAIDISPPYLTSVLAITQLDGPMTIDEYEKNVQSVGTTLQNKKLLESFKYGTLRKISNEDLKSLVSLLQDLGHLKRSKP